MTTSAFIRREARSLQEQDYAGNGKEHACQSSAKKTMDNQYYKGSMGNRMQSKQRRQQTVKLGGRGHPKGGPAGVG